jgi:acetyltransferase-like isoleucine patch superfamily enzyme
MELEHDWFPRPLPENIRIGEGSWMYSAYAFLHYRSRRPVGVRMGRHSGAYSGTLFELGPDGEVTIGDHCAIVGAIISTNGRVVIHDYAFIAHDVVIADSAMSAPGPTEVPSHNPSVVIGRNAWVGARAVLLGGARLGEGAILGAGAVLDSAVPDYAIAAGNPACVVGSAPRRA